MGTKDLAPNTPRDLIATQGKATVEHGGTTQEDLEIPRALLLQALSPDVAEGGLKAGIIINSITKETLGKEFVALFTFKQYVEFDADGKVVFKTIDRTDPRVEAGLKWLKDDKGNDQPPVVTEFLNVLCIFNTDGEYDVAMPMILSFKKSSLRIGRQFNTLLEMKRSSGVAYHGQAYHISTFEKQDGQKRWYLPKVVPAPKSVKIPKAVTDACVGLIRGFRPLIHQMPVEVAGLDEEGQQ